VHLVGFTIEIYYNAWSYKRLAQISFTSWQKPETMQGGPAALHGNSGQTLTMIWPVQ